MAAEMQMDTESVQDLVGSKDLAERLVPGCNGEYYLTLTSSDGTDTASTITILSVNIPGASGGGGSNISTASKNNTLLILLVAIIVIACSIGAAVLLTSSKKSKTRRHRR